MRPGVEPCHPRPIHTPPSTLRQKLRGQVSSLKEELKGTKKEQSDKRKEVWTRGVEGKESSSPPWLMI